MGEHIHVGIIDFFVVGSYIVLWHFLARAGAYWARRNGFTSLSGAVGSLL